MDGLQAYEGSAGKGGGMRLGVTGSRDWTNHGAFTDCVWLLLMSLCFDPDSLVINVGDCSTGIDALCRMEYPHRLFVAHWRQFGKSAGPRRNQEIVGNSDILLAFPLGESRGTRGCMEIAARSGIPVYVGTEQSTFALWTPSREEAA
jgi:hypothetical protein